MPGNRRNNPNDMTITEQIDGVKEYVCESVCRWKEYASSIHEDPDDAKKFLQETYCIYCPCGRL